jgi:hypothetical protein
MSVAQLSLLPDVLADNDIEPVVKRPSVPVAKRIDGRWCWKKFNEDVWVHEPELEQILLAKQEQRKAA